MDLLTATLVQHFPGVNARYPMSPYASRMRAYLFELNVGMTELLSWSVELKRESSTPCDEEEGSFTQEMKLIDHQNIVISQLMDSNRELASRLAELKKRLAQPVPASTRPDEAGSEGASTTIPAPPSGELPFKGRGKAPSKNAAAI